MLDKVLVIGASAGGLTPLIQVIKGLPAAVLLVLHLKEDNSPSKVPKIIARETVLTASPEKSG